MRPSELPGERTVCFRWTRVVGVLVLLIALGSAAWWLARVEPPDRMDHRRFGENAEYMVGVYRDERGVAFQDRLVARLPRSIRRRLPVQADGAIAAVEVRRGGRIVYRATGALFHLPDSEWGWWDRRQPWLKPGLDVTGDGIPNLVIYEWSGKMQDPVVVRVFEAGERFRQIGEMAGYDPRFEDMDGNGVPEVALIDGLFQFDPIFGAPSAEVILRWAGGGYRVAGDLMRRAAPTAEEWAATIERLRGSSEWRVPHRYGEVPGRMFREALVLMYGGLEEWGWRLLREGWKPGSEVDERLLTEFRVQRDRSRYWQELDGMVDPAR